MGLPRRRQAFAAQTQGATAARPLGYSEFDLAGEGRRAHLAAERGVVERDRQIEPEVAPLDLEERMRGVMDRHQGVARRSIFRTGLSLATQADLLALFD